jgi:hypothetical protein
MYQTQVQKVNALRFGSGMVEISQDGQAWTNLGVGNKINFEDKYTPVDIKADNGGLIAQLAKDQECTLKMNLMEIDLAILNQIRGGIDSYSTIAGTPVNGATQEVFAGNWAHQKFIPLLSQGTVAPVVSAVSAATDGALTDNDDYVFGQDQHGNYGIYTTGSAKFTTTNQNLIITYNYTPAAAKVLKSGGLITISSNYVRVTNKRAADGKKFQITIYKAMNQDGLKIDFPADDDPKAWETPLTFKGCKDATRSVGDQLFMIYDEQSVL